MSDDTKGPNKDPLHTERLLWVFFLLSVTLLVVLATVPARHHFSEWRGLQGEYNRLAAEAGSPPVEVGLKQVWLPERGVVDRCVTCHLGMGPGEPIEGHPVFAAHPDVHHDVGKFGCVSCHQGQGRATTSEAAHATGHGVEWHAPLIEPGKAQSGCGTCHSTLVVPPMQVVDRGKYLFDLHGCLSCHAVDGEGGVVGPDLSQVGLRGFDRDWHVRHLTHPGQVVEGSKMMSFGHLPDEDLDALVTYMDTLVGAPDLVAGKALVNSHGCRGCHQIAGAGGDMGPPLDGAGEKNPHGLDFSGVEGEHTLAEWHRAHLLDPAAVVPGSQMPPPEMTEEEIEQVTTYLLSLREAQMPLRMLPTQEAVARLEGRKDHPVGGEDLYRVYCSACHGAGGEGRVLDQLGTRVPAITGEDFLAVASDSYLRETMKRGRPGRNMPAWSGRDGGLSDDEVDAVLAYLRSHEPTPPSFEAVQAATADLEHGAQLYAGNCASCHGGEAEGTVIAPSLVNDEFLTIVDDRFLYQTIVHGRAGTAMPSHKGLSAHSVRSLIAWIDSHRSRDRVDVSRYRARGSTAYGAELYRTQCASCHGQDGGGGVGSALANQAFLASVSDGFLAATIREGRGHRAMRAFGKNRGGIVELEEREIADLVAYLRSLQRPGPAPVLKGHVQGDTERGAELYVGMCAGCHGGQGAGGLAPALTNPGFLASASDGFLQATILRGRAGTAMRSWGVHGFAELKPQEVNDLTAYLRSFERRDTP